MFSAGRATIVPPPARCIVVVLFLLCLIPRVWAGTLHDIICPDAASYLAWANHLEAGDVDSAFQRTGINIYQPLLLLLKYVPGDWFTVAKWWSVAMATLTILPIYGWIRRQFNETLAILGSGFYALHPAMIHDSPLIVRDPTFWFLFALGLYTAWRAVSELRGRWFVAFVLVFGLAIHLRTEGWLLGPVLMIWFFFRFWQARGWRFRLIMVVAILCLVGSVAGWMAYKATVVEDVANADLTTRHLRGAANLLARLDEIPAKSATEGSLSLLVRYAKAFGYLHLLLAGAGVVHWRLRLLQPSKGALLLFYLLSAVMIWICCFLGEMDRRYAFPSVIVSLPTIAVGQCTVARWTAYIANHSRRPFPASFSLWLLVLSFGSACILSTIIVLNPRPLLYDQAEMGQWIRTNYGPGQRIAVNLDETRVLQHYGEATIVFELPSQGPCDAGKGWLSRRKSFPSIILIWCDWRNPSGREPFEAGICEVKALGYQEVPAQELPHTCRQIVVLVSGDLTDPRR